jgi:oligoribonuclease
MVKSKNTLVWMDFEMTGLDPDYDVILEIATVMTDNNLSVIKELDTCIIHQPQHILDGMDDWNQTHHAESGLIDKVLQSDVTIEDAESYIMSILEEYIEPQTALLCGNSIFQDKMFIRRYMKRLYEFLHYRSIDVSTLKELIARWYPESFYSTFDKKSSHRAHDDIHESIAELKYYKHYFL